MADQDSKIGVIKRVSTKSNFEITSTLMQKNNLICLYFEVYLFYSIGKRKQSHIKVNLIDKIMYVLNKLRLNK